MRLLGTVASWRWVLVLGPALVVISRCPRGPVALVSVAASRLRVVRAGFLAVRLRCLLARALLLKVDLCSWPAALHLLARVALLKFHRLTVRLRLLLRSPLAWPRAAARALFRWSLATRPRVPLVGCLCSPDPVAAAPVVLLFWLRARRLLRMARVVYF
jgi:hypothetical protein